jgi:hypothetical protein
MDQDSQNPERNVESVSDILGFCKKCGGTGFDQKKGKPCKFNAKAAKKASKPSKSSKSSKH